MIPAREDRIVKRHVAVIVVGVAIALSAATVHAETVLRLDEVAVGELDPAKASDYADSILMFNVYDTLVLPRQGGPGPRSAPGTVVDRQWQQLHVRVAGRRHVPERQHADGGRRRVLPGTDDGARPGPVLPVQRRAGRRSDRPAHGPVRSGRGVRSIREPSGQAADRRQAARDGEPWRWRRIHGRLGDRRSFRRTAGVREPTSWSRTIHRT